MGRFVSKTIGRLSSLIASFFPKHRNTGARWFFVLAAIFGIFLVASPVVAQGSILSGVADGILWVFAQIMLALARLFIALSVFALKFFIEIAKYNGYVDTPTVVLGWTMVRDVANMFFVVILLVIAFATILGVEQYEWKKTLVKLVLAAVFINFSKLISGLIIDFAHVFTITFLNAVSATAGGNLINMFHLNEIYRISGREFGQGDQINTEVFLGAVIAFLFAGLTLISMGAYLVVMIARVVVLWVLIILSPIAFIMQVLPNTQQWAKEWWDRFGKQVMVAPVMVFFLWLSFATLGTGSFVREDLNLNFDAQGGVSGEAVTATGAGTASGPQKVSLSDVSTWENMANFFIAMAFLMVGLGVVQKLGVVGGSVVSGLTGFGKRVATIATGYAAGRWAVGKAGEAGGDYGKLLEARTIGELRHVRGIRDIPLIGKAGSVRRKAALAKAEELEASRLARYKAEGGGLAQKLLLVPSQELRANAAIQQEFAERTSTAKKTEAVGQLRLNIIKDEEKKYNKKYDELLRTEETASGAIPVSDKKKSELRSMAAKEVGGLISILHKENEALRPSGKFETEQKRVLAGVVDAQRMVEGKAVKAMRAYEMQQVKEDAEDYQDKTYDETMEEIRQNYRAIQSNRGPGGDSKLLENAVQNQARALAHAYSSGFGGYLGGELSKLDDSFANFDFNDSDKNHMLDMALMSAKAKNDFEEGGSHDISNDTVRRKQANIQQQIMKDMKEKKGILMRGLMVGRDKDVKEHNGIESEHQLSVGVDTHGDSVIGFSNLMSGGTYAAPNDLYASGLPPTSTGRPQTGRGRRALKYDLSIKDRRLADIAGGSLGNGQTRTAQIDGSDIEMIAKYVNDEVKSRIADLGDMNSQEIQKLKKEQINRILGGTYARSSYSNNNNKFMVANNEMRDDLAKAFQRFNANYQSATSPAVEDNIKKAIRTLLVQAGAQDENRIKDFVDEVARKTPVTINNVLEIAP